MSKVVAIEALTLDGVMQGMGGPDEDRRGGFQYGGWAAGRGDAADAVARLKKEHPKTLVIFGSGVLVQSLMRRNLVDEYVLQIHPLVLGTGFRLFPDGSPLTKLTLVDSVTTGTGVIIATYRPAWITSAPSPGHRLNSPLVWLPGRGAGGVRPFGSAFHPGFPHVIMRSR